MKTLRNAQSHFAADLKNTISTTTTSPYSNLRSAILTKLSFCRLCPSWLLSVAPMLVSRRWSTEFSVAAKPSSRTFPASRETACRTRPSGTTASSLWSTPAVGSPMRGESTCPLPSRLKSRLSSRMPCCSWLTQWWGQPRRMSESFACCARRTSPSFWLPTRLTMRDRNPRRPDCGRSG